MFLVFLLSINSRWTHDVFLKSPPSRHYRLPHLGVPSPTCNTLDVWRVVYPRLFAYLATLDDMRALRLVSRNTCAWTYQLKWHLDLNIGLPLTLSELGRLLFLFPKAQLQSVCLHTTNTFSLARWPPPPTSDTFSYLACLSITEWGAELTDSYFTIGLPN